MPGCEELWIDFMTPPATLQGEFTGITNRGNLILAAALFIQICSHAAFLLTGHAMAFDGEFVGG